MSRSSGRGGDDAASRPNPTSEYDVVKHDFASPEVFVTADSLRQRESAAACPTDVTKIGGKVRVVEPTDAGLELWRKGASDGSSCPC